MQHYQFTRVWFATEERIQSVTKWIVFSDRGTLDGSSEGLVFRGRKYRLSITTIQSVALVQQRLPWVSYLLSMPIMLIFFAAMGFPLWESATMTVHVGWLLFLFGVMVLGLLFGALVSSSTRWVQVEYEDAQQQRRRAYFADGSLLGWGGIFGGTTRLYEWLNRQQDK